MQVKLFDLKPPPQANQPALNVPQDLRPPSIALGDLFVAIHAAKIFTDPKSVADATPDQAPSDLVAIWQQQKKLPDFNLKTFVSRHFTMPVLRSASYSRKPDESVRDYISGMWDVLTRSADIPVAWSSLLPLPHDYIVPGGRFSEFYYWDSYFTMIGLYEDQHVDLMRNMVRDIASLIERYGHMPNGNRTYYLGRSQPPFFSLMLDLLASHDGQITYTTFLPALQKEYDYWTDRPTDLKPDEAWRHAVKMPDGTVMFRPWDDMNTPRDESYPQDQATAQTTHRAPKELWRDLRAGAETGWDYSSRWLADGKTLSTIQATSLLTIEYNCLIVHLAQTLSHAYSLQGNKEKSAFYMAQAEALQNAINTYLWNEKEGAYFDYNWKTHRQTNILSAATAVPLFLHQAPQDRADAVAKTIEKRLLHAGGLTATDRETGQQWDYPNGWAPNQWMAIKGLEQYGHDTLAAEIGRRWMDRVIGTFEKSGVLLEKYDVVAKQISATGGKGGGEYPMQIGFGWTNGTLLGLMNRYPQNTRKVLDKNPLSDQPSQQPLPPVDAWNANGPDIAVTDKSPLKGVPLSALHTEETQNQKQEEPNTPHASANTPTETPPRMRKELEPNSIPLPVQPFMTPTPTPLLNEAIQHAP
ncbi:MAG: alpha,alpha-trehalase TreF [Acetobacter orientalis]